MLMGVMGGGKTSVVEALCYGLFGNFPSLQKRRVKLAEVVSSWPREEKEAEVRVTFTCNDAEYEVVRVFGSGGSKAELRKNGKLEEAQPEKVTERTEKILKVDYELFSRAIYSEQNGIDRFLNLNPGDRKKQFDELFGIDKFEVVRSNLNKVLNELKTLKEYEERELKRLQIENVQREEEKTKKQLEEVKEECEKCEVELKKATGAEYEKKEKELRELEERESKSNKLKREMARFEGEISGIEKELQGAKKAGEKELDETRQMEQSLRGKIENGKKEAKSISGEIGTANRAAGAAFERVRILKENLNEKQKIENMLKEFKVQASFIREERDGVKNSIENGRNYCAQLKAELDELEKGVCELQKEISTCPICETPLTQEKKESILKEKKEKKRKREEMLKEVRYSLENELKAFESMEKNLKHLEEAERRMLELKEAEKELEKTEKELEENEKRKNSLEIERKIKEENNYEMEAEYAKVSKLRDELERTGKRMERLKELRELLEKHKREEEKMPFDMEKLVSARKEVERISSLKSVLAEKINGLKREEKRMKELLGLHGEKIKEARKKEEKTKEYEEGLLHATVFQNAVVETQKSLREGLVDAVNSAMNEVWSVLYPYEDYLGLRLKAEATDYVLELKRGQEWVAVDGIASGGERVCASLALRIAVATVLVPNLSWLILDEPTHNLDAEGVRTLAKALSEQIPQIVEQTIVITHDENLKDAATAKTYVLNRDKTKGEKTKIEEVNQ